MNLDNVNTNLLVALNAILTSPTLTDAARSLHVTQPALSVALRKLRTHFGDDIVIYKRSGIELTPLGRALAPRVAEIVSLARDTLRLRDQFDPSTASAHFKIRTLEAIEIILFPHLVRIIGQCARHVRISAVPFAADTPTQAFSDELDIAIVRAGMESDQLDKMVLFTETFVAVVWDEHPTIGDHLTLEQYRTARHVSLDPELIRRTHLPVSGRDRVHDGRYVPVVVSSLAALPHVLAGTDLVGLLPRRMAQAYARTFPIRLLSLPFELPPTEIFVQWRSYRAQEPAITWLLDRVREAASYL